ncbi:hypothetical protein [Streptomyces sp. col6]|nr:hypothetical protein [Streptomyces sp. col6]
MGHGFLLVVASACTTDGDFDMIAALTGQPAEWVVPPGSADR